MHQITRCYRALDTRMLIHGGVIESGVDDQGREYRDVMTIHLLPIVLSILLVAIVFEGSLRLLALL